jgi:hypothetical protein
MQQQIVGGGYIDAVTKSELHDELGHKFDAFIRDLYRGKDYFALALPVQNPAAQISISNLMYSGYSWSMKMVSLKLSNATAVQVSVYLGENINVAPVANGLSVVNGTQNEFIFLWSSNQLVVKDQITLTFLASAGTITAYNIRAEQVPTVMQGKL